MTQTDHTLRPVQLQVNLAGAWKTVLQFDAGNVGASIDVQRAAEMLHAVAPVTSWRIATCDKVPVVLRHLARRTYGMWISRPESEEGNP